MLFFESFCYGLEVVDFHDVYRKSSICFREINYKWLGPYNQDAVEFKKIL